MLFNAELDTGDKIVFYFVPDTYSETPKVRIQVDGEIILVMEANERREALVVAGRHETGMCGFVIDETILPSIRSAVRLAIFDEATGILVYRRPIAGQVWKKALYLSSSILPPQHININMQEKFQYYANRLEALGHETVSQLFMIHNIGSIFLSGRILYKNYAHNAENGFLTFFFIESPYVTLAERILILSNIKKRGNAEMILGERDALVFRQAMDFVLTLTLDDERALKRSFRDLTPEIASVFVDPVVRMLTTSTPHEMARSGAVAWALDTLATFAAVGTRDDPALFADTIAAVLDLKETAVPPPPLFASVADLAHRLETSHAVDHLIGKDLELYHYVQKAFGGES